MRLKPLLVILTIAALLVAGRALDAPARLKEVLAWIDGLGAFGPAAFIGIYILATIFFLPGSILTLGAGLLFGVVWGSVYVSIASTAGATAAFLIGRHLARDWVAGRIAGNAKFKLIDEAVAAEGWKFVFLIRLSPAFPFNLLNYAFGLTQVRLRDYVLPSWAGMIPGTVMYVYIGSLAGDLAALGSGGGERTPASWALTAVGFLATAAVTVYATSVARSALKNRIRAEDP